MRTENMTDRAKLVFRLAEKRARQFGSATVEPEHVLLGAISEEAGVGGVALRRLGATHEALLSVLPPPPQPLPTLPTTPLPWSPATDAAVDRGDQERAPLNRNYICTEHLVLGLAFTGGGKVPDMLRHVSITGDQLKKQVLFLLQNG
ncbi:Clp protease N-terminal domain-containing protein [Anatilimnocola floriformis]|uniref:Clp protease N-terminal domain-containing protein n=1 Tax=Anatilimnocola floriformis TaxID=2948575 RepID=UPI0020C52EBE|nr:Clp protease N-terminal domain-containing protein [Anatilimnocola floriformis]